MAIVFVGIDLAKNVFTVRGVSEAGWPERVRPAVTTMPALGALGTA
jgi:hypothetical protein